MISIGRIRNPKALKLEGLENVKKKVTVGFKCDPSVKLYLAAQAQKTGITLSEYVEALVQDTEMPTQLDRQEISLLKQQLAFYENDTLLAWLRQYQGQEVKYTNAKGETASITIKEAKDVYTIMINSFKLKK